MRSNRLEIGPRVKRRRTQIDQLASILDSLRDRHDLVILSSDASSSFRLSRELRETPGRVIELGVAEASAGGIAHGLALKGVKVLVVGFSAFLVLRALEPIRSLLCYHNSDVTLLGGMSGLSASHDGFMHQSTDDVGVLSAIGSIRVFSPSDESSLSATMNEVLQAAGPKFVRLCRLEIDLGDHAASALDWSPVAVRLNFGEEFAVISYGHVLQECAKAVIAVRSMRGRLIEVRQLQPFDSASLFGAIGNARFVLSVEDHLVESGLGGKLRALLAAERGGSCRVVNLGLKEGQFGASGRLDELLAAHALDAAAIVAAISAHCR